MIQRAVPYITSLYARSLRVISAPSFLAPRWYRKAVRCAAPRLFASSPLVRPPCFTLTSRYPPPYEADNHLLSHREDVARRGWEVRISQTRSGYRYRALFPRFTINLILLKREVFMKIKNQPWKEIKLGRRRDSPGIMHSRRLKDKREKKSNWKNGREHLEFNAIASKGNTYSYI